MGFFNKVEKRSAIASSASGFLEFFGLAGGDSVTVNQALGVPSVWAAVNFMSGTIAGLPLDVFDRAPNGVKKKVKATAASPVVAVLHSAVNDSYSSFQWRFDMMNAVLTDGRFVTYIERNAAGQPINLFPLCDATVARLPNGRKQYKHTAGGRTQVYDESDVIDVTFMLERDLLSHRSPLKQCSVSLAKAVHANSYGSKLFKNGGLPAFILQGPFGSEKAATRASDDVAESTKEAARKGANVLSIPLGHKLEPLTSDPAKMQMIETQRFAVEEVARVYQLPPVFLQDLTHGTYSNTEQQDLHLVKHTLKRWLEQLEAEMNLKLFGRNSKRFCEFNVDGMLRGDYKTRMEGNARAIQTGQLAPNEARAMDNREPMPGGDQLLIQGATVPLDGHTGDDLQPMQGKDDDA